MFQIQYRRLGATVDLQLLENVAEIIFDRLVAQAHLLGDLLVGLALGYEGKDAALLVGKDGQAALFGRRRTIRADEVQQSRRQGGIEDELAAGDVVDRPWQRPWALISFRR